MIEEYVSGEIKSGSNLETIKYGAVWKGYFVASTTGNYVFRGVADDSFAVYLNTENYGSKESLTEPIIYSDNFTPEDRYPNYYRTDYPNFESTPVALEAGRHYYMEAYHVNSGGPAFFSLSV